MKQNKPCLEEILKRLHEKIFPAVEHLGFMPTQFSSDYFGQDPHHPLYEYTFYNFDYFAGIEFLIFQVWPHDLRTNLFYNRIAFDQEINGFEDLQTINRVWLRIPPISSSRMQIYRYAKVPFLYWPVEYQVKWNGKTKSIHSSVSKVFDRLESDIEDFEFFRSEWDKKHVPHETTIAELERSPV